MKKLFASDLLPLGVVAALGPLFVFPRERWMWVLLAIPLFWLGALLAGRSWFRRTPIDAAIVLLAVWAFLSMLGVSEIEGSISKAAGFVYGIVVFYAVVAAARNGKRIKWGIGVFLAAGIVVAAVGTLSRPEIGSAAVIDSSKVFSALPRIDMNIERAEEGVNPNPLGGTLLLFIPLGLALIPGIQKKNGEADDKNRILFALVILSVVIVDFAAIVYGRSFGAWAGLIFSLMILGRRKRWLKAVIGIGIVVALALFLVGVDRPVSPLDRSLRGVLVHSINSRYPLWAAGVAAIKDRPFLGVGLDQLRLREDMGYERAHAHNQFIHTAAELGIPGLAAYLAILVGAGWMTHKVEKSKKPKWMKDAAQGLAVGQAGLAVFGLADAIVLGAKPGLFFWISLALITAIYLAPDEEEKAELACS